MRNESPTHATVDRTLNLLLLLRDGEAVSVTNAAEHLGVSASTAHRLLTAFRERGFATQTPDRRYAAGPNLETSRSRRSSFEVRDALRPDLIAVQAALDETVNLWVLEGLFVRNLDGVESRQALAIRVNAWDRVPASGSAAGKALLARFDGGEIDRMHRAQFAERHASARFPTIEHLIGDLRRVRELGFATNLEEVEIGVCGVGVAVETPADEVAIAVSCGVPSVRFDDRRCRSIARTLRAAAERMGAVLRSAERPGE